MGKILENFMLDAKLNQLRHHLNLTVIDIYHHMDKLRQSIDEKCALKEKIDILESEKECLTGKK